MNASEQIQQAIGRADKFTQTVKRLRENCAKEFLQQVKTNVHYATDEMVLLTLETMMAEFALQMIKAEQEQDKKQQVSAMSCLYTHDGKFYYGKTEITLSEYIEYLNIKQK